MTLDHLENYLKVFEEINKSSVINGKPDLQNYRKKNWDEFVKTGIPVQRRGNERWKYTNLKPLLDLFQTPIKINDEDLKKYLESNIPVLDDQILIVLVNGMFSKNLSSNFENITRLHSFLLKNFVKSFTSFKLETEINVDISSIKILFL